MVRRVRWRGGSAGTGGGDPAWLYHRTTDDRADRILAGGVRDGVGAYSTSQAWTGVRLADVPLDVNEGADGDAFLEVDLDLPEEEIARYGWIEDGKPDREFLVPAEVVNRAGVVRRVDFDPWHDDVGEERSERDPGDVASAGDEPWRRGADRRRRPRPTDGTALPHRAPAPPQRSIVQARKHGAGPVQVGHRAPASGARWRVAEELPAYGERVRARVAQLGAEHPYVKTEYELVELDAEGGLFPPARLAQLPGDHPRVRRGEPGKVYAGLLDVAGEAEEGSGPEAFDNASRRDSTALTVVEVVTKGRQLADYRIVDRRAWTGTKHTALHGQLLDLARNVWGLRALVVDATGVGAGLASFLADALGRGSPKVAVAPFVFSAASKSQLGWDFVGMVDAGRVKEYAPDGEELTRLAWHQYAACEYEVLPGPGKLLRWSVPAGRGHDDLLVSAALAARLDAIDWRPRTARGSGG